jgi:hypothetical protein
MVVKFRNTILPPPPQPSLHRRAALSNNSKGTRSVYSRENPKSSLYCETSMGRTVPTNLMNFSYAWWTSWKVSLESQATLSAQSYLLLYWMAWIPWMATSFISHTYYERKNFNTNFWKCLQYLLVLYVYQRTFCLTTTIRQSNWQSVSSIFSLSVQVYIFLFLHFTVFGNLAAGYLLGQLV